MNVQINGLWGLLRVDTGACRPYRAQRQKA